MTEPQPPVQEPAASAGELLRAAREGAGVHIGVLAATLKVPVRKLELLEGNRFDELPGSTFVRALSLSVCRVLKCDPAPVLAALPRQEQVATALAGVTHHKSARFARSDAPVVVTRASSARLGWRLTALILALASVVWWAPKEWSAPWSGGPEASGGSASAPPVASPTVAGAAVPVLATSSPSAIATPGGAASEPLVQTTHGAPLSAGMASQATTASAISVTEASWIEATDLQGRPVWTRTLTPGEVVDLDSGAGVRLTIGNAAATQVRWRGRPVDLSAVTRDNVARLELK